MHVTLCQMHGCCHHGRSASHRAPPIWEGNPISCSLVKAVPISQDEDGCPLPSQPFPRIDVILVILRQLIPLWPNGITSWAQIARLAPGGRAYLLSEDELQWANPHFTQTSMAAARQAITYLHRLMASTCEADLAGICSRALPKQIQQGHFSPRWRALLRTTLESLPPGPSPLEVAHGLKQSSIRTFLSANNVVAAPPQHLPPPAPTAHAKLSRLSSDLPIRDAYKARRIARRLESATAPSPLPTEGDAIGEYASIACILSRETPLPAPTRRSRNGDEYFLVEWRPEIYPYHVVPAQRDRSLTTVSMIVLDEFTELAPIGEAELDPLCISCSKGAGGSGPLAIISTRLVDQISARENHLKSKDQQARDQPSSTKAHPCRYPCAYA